MRRARVRFPTPGSPTSRTGAVVRPASRTCSASRRRAGEVSLSNSGPKRCVIRSRSETSRSGSGATGAASSAARRRDPAENEHGRPLARRRSGKKSTSHQRPAGSRPGSSRRTRIAVPCRTSGGGVRACSTIAWGGSPGPAGRGRRQTSRWASPAGTPVRASQAALTKRSRRRRSRTKTGSAVRPKNACQRNVAANGLPPAGLPASAGWGPAQGPTARSWRGVRRG